MLETNVKNLIKERIKHNKEILFAQNEICELLNKAEVSTKIFFSADSKTIAEVFIDAVSFKIVVTKISEDCIKDEVVLNTNNI